MRACVRVRESLRASVCARVRDDCSFKVCVWGGGGQARWRAKCESHFPKMVSYYLITGRGMPVGREGRDRRGPRLTRTNRLGRGRD